MFSIYLYNIYIIYKSDIQTERMHSHGSNASVVIWKINYKPLVHSLLFLYQTKVTIPKWELEKSVLFGMTINKPPTAFVYVNILVNSRRGALLLEPRQG